LAKLLLDHGYEVVFEEFKMNPFWKAFYSNPIKYNFETEITFILQHYHALKRKLEENTNVVCDFSFTQDLAYGMMGLKTKQLDIFQSVYNYIMDEIGEPGAIVHMKCSPEVLIRRIRLRGREEEALINVDFLFSLDSFVKDNLELIRLKRKDLNIWEIDTGKINIIENHSDQAFVLNRISELIN
jgi:deoxyadenosine/deoxycytidine kinase